MKCLSLWQPWATLLVAGVKHVETRGWPTRFRGPLLIHAARKWSAELSTICRVPAFKLAFGALGIQWMYVNRRVRKPLLPFGAIIGRVDVIECYVTDDVVVDDGLAFCHGGGILNITATEKEFGDYSPGRFAFLCDNAVKFDKPIPFPGKQGFFDVPDELLK